MTDELAHLTRRQMLELRAKIDKELQSCVIDGREGAQHYSIKGGNTKASIKLCLPCFERLREPESRVNAE